MRKEQSKRKKNIGTKAGIKHIRRKVAYVENTGNLERKANKAFFTLFNSSPVAKALIDINTNRYVEVNRGFLKLFECKKETVIGKNPDELGLWADSSQRSMILKEFRKNKFGSFNVDIISQKGKLKNVIISTEQIILSEKEYLLGYLIDNTEIHEYEKRLKESERKYRILLNNNQNAIYEFDFEKVRYKYISPSIETILGISPEVFIKNRFNIITPLLDKEHRKKIRAHYKLLKSSTGKKKRSFRIEYPFTLKNQDQIWIADDQTVMYGKSGKAESVIGNISDITDRKTNETLLMKSEEQYKVLFFSNPLPMWIFDFHTLYFLSVNDAAIKHYGYSKPEFLKMKLTDIRPKREISKYLGYRRKVIDNNWQNKSYNAGVWKHLKKNGEIIDVEITRTPVIFEGHDAVLILANDITGRLKTESTLIKRNREISELYRAGKELSKTLRQRIEEEQKGEKL